MSRLTSCYRILRLTRRGSKPGWVSQTIGLQRRYLVVDWTLMPKMDGSRDHKIWSTTRFLIRTFPKFVGGWGRSSGPLGVMLISDNRERVTDLHPLVPLSGIEILRVEGSAAERGRASEDHGIPERDSFLAMDGYRIEHILGAR
jgi:hypothetical protein